MLTIFSSVATRVSTATAESIRRVVKSRETRANPCVGDIGDSKLEDERLVCSLALRRQEGGTMADTPAEARSETLRIGACRLGTRVIFGLHSVTAGSAKTPWPGSTSPWRPRLAYARLPRPLGLFVTGRVSCSVLRVTCSMHE